MTTTETESYPAIAEAIRYLDDHFREQPSLEEVANHVGLSRFHLQRVFKRWAGVTPKRFLQFLTLQYAKDRLSESASVLETSLDAGLSGPSRLHDLFVSLEAVTPGDWKTRGEGLEIRWGSHPSPFGPCLVGVTDRGVCWLSFGEEVLDEVAECWGGADLRQDSGETRKVLNRIFAPARKSTKPLPLLVKGTNFQVQVWQALLRIPPGDLVTYGDVAQAIGRPDAVRAVGTAVGRNAISYLIPCHRVIRNTGHLGGYRWGLLRKKAMLAREAARRL